MGKRIAIALFCAAGAWAVWPAPREQRAVVTAEEISTQEAASPDREKGKAIPSRLAPSAPVAAVAKDPAAVNAPAAERSARIAELGFSPFTGRPSLGEAYRDRRGLVWGAIRKLEGATSFDDSSSLKVTQQEAAELCARDGNRLPTLQDYAGFVSDFGARPAQDPYTDRVTTNEGYAPFLRNSEEFVLPTLTYQRVWTATLDPADANRAYVFNGHYGYYGAAERSWKTAFLCVFRPEPARGR